MQTVAFPQQSELSSPLYGDSSGQLLPRCSAVAASFKKLFVYTTRGLFARETPPSPSSYASPNGKRGLARGTPPCPARKTPQRTRFRDVIGVGRLIVRFHHAYVIPSFLDVVVRLCLVIVNSDCSHHSCMVHIAKTGPLRCCSYMSQRSAPPLNR